VLVPHRFRGSNLAKVASSIRSAGVYRGLATRRHRWPRAHLHRSRLAVLLHLPVAAQPFCTLGV